MKLIGTCMASNEADVIEAFVRHNLRVLDTLVVLDHGSLDATLGILERLAAEGLPLLILRDGDRAFRQGERQTQMARRFLVELDAQFCFALDADEFIKTPSRAGLEAALHALPPGHYGLVPHQNYVQGASHAEPHPVRRLTRRLRVEGAPSRKVVLRRDFATLEGAQVSLGNHAALQVTRAGVRPLAHTPLAGIFHAHFPVRSPEQVAKKALLGWLSHRLTRPERFAKPGGEEPASHWRELFARLAAGTAVGPDLVDEALKAYGAGSAIAADDLVEDPLPVDDELRYAESANAAPLAALAAWADRLVSDINAASAARTDPAR